MKTDDVQSLDLSAAAGHMLDECRMVLPGIQALFGFQLIAVFNEAFSKKLARSEQLLHLTSMILVVVAIALVMAPAAIHRLAEPRSVSSALIRVSSRLLLLAMSILAVGICIDVYVVATMILPRSGAAVISLTLLAAFTALWVVLPTRFKRGLRAV